MQAAFKLEQLPYSSASVTEHALASVICCALRSLGWLVRTVHIIDPGPKRPTPKTLSASEGFNVRRMLEGGIESAIKRTLCGTVLSAIRKCRQQYLYEHAFSPGVTDTTHARDRTLNDSTSTSSKAPKHTLSYVNGDPKESTKVPMSWVEVFATDRAGSQRWVPLLPLCGSVDKPEKAQENRLLRYVFAFNSGACKDVTLRYVRNWSECAQHRVDTKWLDEFLRPLMECEPSVLPWPEGAEHPVHRLPKEEQKRRVQYVRNKLNEEDVAMESKLITEKVPTQASKLKNHPLYVIDKHLSKDQVVHPRNTKTIVGFVDGQPVFPRKCVRQLKSADAWLREDNLVVRPDEKGQPIKCGASNGQQNDESVPLYGAWQTEEYVQEPVRPDGTVPKNERGNVDLARFANPPPGSVHIKGNRIAASARQARIDFAEALVAFERKRGSRKATPKFDGIVVARSNQDKVLQQHAVNESKREWEQKRKRETEAASRWRSLLGSIWAKNRLNAGGSQRCTAESANVVTELDTEGPIHVQSKNEDDLPDAEWSVHRASGPDRVDEAREQALQVTAEVDMEPVDASGSSSGSESDL